MNQFQIKGWNVGMKIVRASRTYALDNLNSVRLLSKIPDQSNLSILLPALYLGVEGIQEAYLDHHVGRSK